jgi:hypothetical protein
MQNLLFKHARELSAKTMWKHPYDDSFEIEFSFCNGSAAINARCCESSRNLKQAFGGDFTTRIINGEQFEYKLDRADYLFFTAKSAHGCKIDLKIEFRHNPNTGTSSSGVMFFGLLPEEFDAFFSTLAQLSGEPGECCALRLNRGDEKPHISVMQQKRTDAAQPGTGSLAISA